MTCTCGRHLLVCKHCMDAALLRRKREQQREPAVLDESESIFARCQRLSDEYEEANPRWEVK